MRIRRWLVPVLITALGGPTAAIAWARSTAEQVPVPAPPAVEVPSSARVAAARAVLPTIVVKGRAPKTGYNRDRFGDGWAKVGGCSVRERVLARDLTGEHLAPNRCTVLDGDYVVEPYTGRAVSYVRHGGYAHALDIDHVYPLGLAWQQGAWQWSDARRDSFANDRANLWAVSPSTNRQKGDSGPASWLPVKTSRCEYVARFVVVAGKWRLSMNRADHDMAERELGKC